MGKFDDNLILRKLVKPSETKINEINVRRFFLFVDGKKSLGEIKKRCMIEAEDVDKIVSSLLEMGYIGVVDGSKISFSGENSSALVSTPPKSEILALSEKIKPLLKKFIGPLADVIIEKELNHSRDAEDFFGKLKNFSEYIADEEDKNSYIKEIQKFMGGVNV